MNIRAKYFFLLLALIAFNSCQMGYIINSAHQQFSMMKTRVDIKTELKKTDLSDDTRKKLNLALVVREFSFDQLKLKKTDNYNTYINLNRPYVTWVVHGAYRWEMKTYEWSYPFLGDLPYKGFFTEAEAIEESKKLEDQGYDSFVRGVSAYSTLGYFTDSVLSSMLNYKEHDLVNTLIHELVHTTLYIKNNADFNERLAVFIGNKGTELFYKQLEGENSKTLDLIKKENADDVIFSQFVSKRLAELESWYKSNGSRSENDRESQFEKIKKDFNQNELKKMQTKNYNKTFDKKINNAYLGLFKTYLSNMDDFEKVYQKYNGDLLLFIEKMKQLEKSKDPMKDLKTL